MFEPVFFLPFLRPLATYLLPFLLRLTGMEAAGSITACARSPIGFRRPRVPTGSARVSGLCYTDSNVTFTRVDFRPEVRDFSDRLKASAVLQLSLLRSRRRLGWRLLPPVEAAGVPSPPLDLTEDNINRVLADARVELAQLFDTSVGMTGEVELADLDGPFVKIGLRGRFWHKRSTVVARVGNYLKQRIPEILEVDIEDEKQLDDSPENF